MSSEQLIAVATDALRGLVQGVLPAGNAVVVGLPAAGAREASGLFVHLIRVGTIPALRQAPPVLRADGVRLRPQIGLQLDYLIGGSGEEALAELGLLGAALQALGDSPVREGDSLSALLSQPERLASLSPGLLTLQWRVLDLPVEQVSGVWLASGMRQRGGVFCRAEAVWQAVPI